LRLSKDRFRLGFELPDELFDFVFGAALNLVFLALVALLLWPLGKLTMALSLAKGFYILWVVTILTATAIDNIQRFFRIDPDTHIDAYVISNFSHSLLMLSGWSAFAALTVRGFVVDVSVWVASILYVVGFLSSYVAFIILSAIYTGGIYKLLNLTVALASFILFAVWPAAARVLYGWFFNLF
jgi:hypothetical protein